MVVAVLEGGGETLAHAVTMLEYSQTFLVSRKSAQSLPTATRSNKLDMLSDHLHKFVESCPTGGPGYSCYLLLSNLTGSRYNFRYN